MPRPQVAGAIQLNHQVTNALHSDRLAFAARTRAARAVLGLSQVEFAAAIGLTQKSVHRIEQGSVDPKLRTRLVMERYWRDNGIEFEDLPCGGFRMGIRSATLLIGRWRKG